MNNSHIVFIPYSGLVYLIMAQYAWNKPFLSQFIQGLIDNGISKTDAAIAFHG